MPAISRLLALALLVASGCSDDRSDPATDDSDPGDLTGSWRVVAPGEEDATQGIELVHDVETGSLTGAFCTPDDTWMCGEEKIEGEVVERTLTITWTVRINGELRNETLTAELNAGGTSFTGTVTQRLGSGEVKEIEVTGSRW